MAICAINSEGTHLYTSKLEDMKNQWHIQMFQPYLQNILLINTGLWKKMKSFSRLNN